MKKCVEISTKNPLDINKLAVLTAVNAVHEYIKLKEDYERLEQKLYGKRGMTESMLNIILIDIASFRLCNRS